MGMIEAVVAGLGPAGAVFVAYLLVHRSSWRREDRHRNHEARVDAYKDFLWICHRVYNDETGEETFLELKQAYYAVCLVAGTKEVMRSAERLAAPLEPMPSNDSPEKDIKNTVKPEVYTERLDDFFDKARLDLGNNSTKSWFLSPDYRRQYQYDLTGPKDSLEEAEPRTTTAEADTSTSESRK